MCIGNGGLWGMKEYGEWRCMGNEGVWVMNVYGKWRFMGNEWVWGMKVYGEWRCMGNEGVWGKGKKRKKFLGGNSCTLDIEINSWSQSYVNLQINLILIYHQ